MILIFGFVLFKTDGQFFESEDPTPLTEDVIENNPYLLLGILFLNQAILAVLVLIGFFKAIVETTT